ncbi:MAG: response regulator [Bdellovibrionota bacterium]
MSANSSEKLRNRTIVIVDDSEAARQSMKTKLEALGARVYTAGQADRMVAIVRGLIRDETRPDLIVLDPNLPGCFGLTALQQLYTAIVPDTIPTLVISGGFDELGMKNMALYGALAYLRKPVHLDRAVTTILEVLTPEAAA